MGLMAPPLYGKSKFYEKKKQRILKKIAKLEEKVKICDKEISKENV